MTVTILLRNRLAAEPFQEMLELAATSTVFGQKTRLVLLSPALESEVAPAALTLLESLPDYGDITLLREADGRVSAPAWANALTAVLPGEIPQLLSETRHLVAD